MKIVSNELKSAIKQPTTQRKGRILVNGNYHEVYNVEYYADSYNEGNVIGNAIASQLDFDLPYMDKFETFKYYDGVWTGTEYEYVDFGTFTVFDEQDEDEFNKHITAFDNLIKFNKQFEDVGGYPKTLYEELKNICNQAKVELENTNIPNGNFVIENNQFVANENLKTVLKSIEQISGTFGIIKNDKLVLQLKNITNETINKDQHEPITWKRRSYGINQVVLGMQDVQGEYVLKQDDEDIAINGVHKLVINDNPFVYTQQKREQVIDELFNQVKGFGYVPYDLKMEWLNYMDIGDTITIDGVETIILRIYGKSPKSLESEMSAPAIIDSAVEYSNNTFSLSQRVSRTEFGVDKNAKEITGVVETTENIRKEINPTKQESGTKIIIEDASNNPLIDLEIEGKSEQDGIPTPDTPVQIKSVGTYNQETGKYEIEVKINNESNTNTLIIKLNEPLRSLPNGVKDIAYIKNNKLYVDRNIRSIILNGNEDWKIGGNSLETMITNGNLAMYVSIDDLKKTNMRNDVFCDKLTTYTDSLWNGTKEGINSYLNDNKLLVSINIDRFEEELTTTTYLTLFKDFLSKNNLKVTYSILEPYTEEIGEIKMPSTFKGINNILTTDDLFPIINLTYVRDTIIADYVENRVTELKITENEIKESVESVSSSVDGLNTTINRVEEITTDNSQIINIISTNIDQTTGEVREVTTTTGFTFNADGMTIDDGTGFKAEHTADGTYYKDGNSIVGQYTKDGSKQKDLELFGTYSYGKESIDDTPMFIGQLYRDENNEQCFGHFYNGGE